MDQSGSCFKSNNLIYVLVCSVCLLEHREKLMSLVDLICYFAVKALHNVHITVIYRIIERLALQLIYPYLIVICLTGYTVGFHGQKMYCLTSQIELRELIVSFPVKL